MEQFLANITDYMVRSHGVAYFYVIHQALKFYKAG